MPVKLLVAHNARSDCGGLESSRSRRPTHQWMAIFADKAQVASYFMLAASFPLATLMSARFAAICNPPEIVSSIQSAAQPHR